MSHALNTDVRSPITGTAGDSASSHAFLNGQHRNVCIFTVDVEDWFHILDLPTTPQLSEWDALPSRVEKNFRKLLGIFDEHGAKVTCFVLGWVARRFPHLVKEADQAGHEIASHGYAHRLIYELTPDEFLQDCRASKDLLEDIIGRRVLGYRAAGFSATETTGWFYEKLIEAGFLYDSSVFPAMRGHGGMRNGHREPHVVHCSAGQIAEFPMTVEPVLGRPICFFGGGYLRLFPYAVTRHMAVEVMKAGRPVIFYVHPREIDPEHPRLPMSFKRKFKSYVNLESTEGKVRRLLSEFEMTNFEHVLENGRGNCESLPEAEAKRTTGQETASDPEQTQE